MARAAVVTDRLMARLGLPGRAFLPLVVGFGCNVPAISAVRVLPDARHRLLTALLVPFTSCSARLTVYVMVAATFFPAPRGHGGVRDVRHEHPAGRPRRAPAALHADPDDGLRPARARPAALPAPRPAPARHPPRGCGCAGSWRPPRGSSWRRSPWCGRSASSPPPAPAGRSARSRSPTASTPGWPTRPASCSSPTGFAEWHAIGRPHRRLRGQGGRDLLVGPDLPGRRRPVDGRVRGLRRQLRRASPGRSRGLPGLPAGLHPVRGDAGRPEAPDRHALDRQSAWPCSWRWRGCSRSLVFQIGSALA